jgi:hypothetical protein
VERPSSAYPQIHDKPTGRLTPMQSTLATTKVCEKCRQSSKDDDGLECKSVQPEGHIHFVCSSCLETALEDNLACHSDEVSCPYPDCPNMLSVKRDLYGIVSAFHYEMHCIAKHGNSEMAQRIAELDTVLGFVETRAREYGENSR